MKKVEREEEKLEQFIGENDRVMTDEVKLLLRIVRRVDAVSWAD